MVTSAKKSIANFKLREGLTIGAMVTLRRERMWEFLDRLVTFALPRVRDFKGVSPKAFDGHGNYTLGLREQIIFPEINYDKIDKIKGMNISFVTTAANRRRGARAPASPRHAVQELDHGEDRWRQLPVQRSSKRAEVRGAAPQPLQGVRARRARSSASSSCAASASASSRSAARSRA